MQYAFTKWEERTTTSSLGRHLGHYKALIVSDGEENNKLMQTFFSMRDYYAYNYINII